MRVAHTYSRHTREAAQLLGLEIARARRMHHWTAASLSERAGISRMTLHKIENGDPTVGLGIAFEVATLVGVPLFGVAGEELASLTDRSADRLALLPARIREPEHEVHDDF
ncbi:MAG: helix-turn-helix domain-containing protein [Actinomycetota bacterium]|nr:helix-turn-helix domain-containing protein [Actinomycetota bacterium]